MEIKGPYLMAMREQDPKMFMALRRAGTLDQHLQQVAEQASRMLHDLLAQAPKGKDGHPTPAAEREAEETVRATLIEFQAPRDPQMLEPPDDLPTSGQMPTSEAKTSASSRAH